MAGSALRRVGGRTRDRKSTRLNSSHGYISYAVFCLKKKKKTILGYGSRQPTTMCFNHFRGAPHEDPSLDENHTSSGDLSTVYRSKHTCCDSARTHTGRA